MSVIPKIYRGEDKDIEVTIQDSSLAPIVISTLEGLLIYVDVDGTVIARYSKNVIAGHGAITTINDAQGIVSVKLQESQTKNAKIGIVGVEVKISQTDVNYENNDKESTERVEEAAELVDAKTNLTKP